MILGVPARPGLRIMVASKPVDFRKGMDSLAALVTLAYCLAHARREFFDVHKRTKDRRRVSHWRY